MKILNFTILLFTASAGLGFNSSLHGISAAGFAALTMTPTRHLVISQKRPFEGRRKKRKQAVKKYKTIYHKVKRRDTLRSIARKYKVSRRHLIRRNRLQRPYRLRTGRYLNVKRIRIKKKRRRVVVRQNNRYLKPRKRHLKRGKRTELVRVRTYRHRVRRGETVRSIARGFKVSQRKIIRWNRLRRPYRLRTGQTLIYSKKTTVVKTRKLVSRKKVSSSSRSRRSAKKSRKSKLSVIKRSSRDKKPQSSSKRPKPISRAGPVVPLRVRKIKHTVRRGDTLRQLAKHYKVSQKQIIFINRMRAPYRLRPGRKLTIKILKVGKNFDSLNLGSRKKWNVIKPGTRRSEKIVSQGRNSHKYNVKIKKPSTLKGNALNHLGKKRAASNGTVSRHVSNETNGAPGTSHRSVINQRVVQLGPNRNGSRRWGWPANGRLASRFSRSSKGIKITGQLGQGIFAAAKGKIVYIGNSLIRYGNLVIIKHDKIFFTAYAHNRRLLVREGQEVRRGQKIAEMGSASSGKIVLHFEIRKHGQPVDPLRYLPEK